MTSSSATCVTLARMRSGFLLTVGLALTGPGAIDMLIGRQRTAAVAAALRIGHIAWWPAAADSFNELVRSLLEARRLLDWALDDASALTWPDDVIDTLNLHIEEAKAKLDQALGKLRE